MCMNIAIQIHRYTYTYAVCKSIYLYIDLSIDLLSVAVLNIDLSIDLLSVAVLITCKVRQCLRGAGCRVRQALSTGQSCGHVVWWTLFCRGPPERHLETSVALHGRLLGTSWTRFGRSLALLEALGGVFEASWRLLGALGDVLGALAGVLEPSGRRLGRS